MPFKPWHEKRVVLKAYYPLPEDVLEDTDQAIAWARRSVDAAIAAAKHKPAPGLPDGTRTAQPRRGGNRVAPASRIRRSRGAAD
jgi:hypothetical protein